MSFAKAADANYYYAIDNGDGTYTRTTDRIPENPSAGEGADAKVNQLIGGTGGGYDDEFTITSDVLPGYQLVPSLTQVSSQKKYNNEWRWDDYEADGYGCVYQHEYGCLYDC